MPKTAEPRKVGNRWRISAYDDSGERVFRSFKKRADAIAWHRANYVERSTGLALIERATTFDELEKRWISAKRAKRSLGDDKSRIATHLRPAFGGLRLSDITPKRIDELDARLEAATYAVATRRQVLGLLRSMFKLAVAERLMVQPPPVRLPSQHEQPYQWIPTRDGISALLVAAEQYGAGQRGEYPGLRAMWGTAVWTGLRAGELCSLTLDRVDMERRIITVAASWDQPYTKSNRIRHVPILDSTRDELKPWLEERAKLWPDTPLLFPNERGRMHFDASARPMAAIFHSCLTTAKLPRMGFHALRHTFASHWVMSGGDIFKLNRILGHSDMKLTMRYAHLAPNAYAGDLGRL